MKEKWKDVPLVPFNEMYQVSDLGNFREKETKKKLTLWPRNDGGYTVKFYYTDPNTGEKEFYSTHAHRVVMLAFKPEKTIFNPDGTRMKNPHNAMIHHKDHNRTNNAISNLVWCDAKYNANH